MQLLAVSLSMLWKKLLVLCFEELWRHSESIARRLGVRVSKSAIVAIAIGVEGWSVWRCEVFVSTRMRAELDC